MAGNGMIVGIGRTSAVNAMPVIRILIPFVLRDNKVLESPVDDVNVLLDSRKTSGTLSNALPLRHGTRGAGVTQDAIKEYQHYLRELGYTDAQVHYGNAEQDRPVAEIRYGDYGTTTAATTSAFQTASDLTATSDCNLATLQAVLKKLNRDDPIAWIEPHPAADNQPQMPFLVFECAPLAGMAMSANLEITYTRPYRNNRDGPPAPPVIHVHRFPEGEGWHDFATGETDWKIYLEYSTLPFFGGNAELHLQFLTPNREFVVFNHTVNFRIGGKNPKLDRCKNSIDAAAAPGPANLPDISAFAYAIARHESSGYNNQNRQPFYNQFWIHNIPQHGRRVNGGFTYAFRNGEPLWVRSSGETGVGGLGIMQATGVNGDPGIDLPEDVMWNWRRSVDVVIAEIRNIHIPKATALINGLANIYRVQDGWPDIRNQREGHLSAFDAATVTYYNGMDGGAITGILIGTRRVPSCWRPIEETHTWRFLRNRNDYVRLINAQIP